MVKQEHTDGIWILCEIKEGRIIEASYETISRAVLLSRKKKAKLCALALGYNIERGDLQGLIEMGIDEVYYSDDVRFARSLPDDYVQITISVLKKHKPDIFIAAATTFGRTVMPAIAAGLNTGLTADCTDLDIDCKKGLMIQVRPAIGGNIMAVIETPLHRPQMATVRTNLVSLPNRTPNRRGKIKRINFFSSKNNESCSEWLDSTKIGSKMPLDKAEIVVAGGRGLRKAENFSLIHKLADELGAAVAASRAAVDMGWVDYHHQVGLSGKTVTPRVYIAIGISGAVQHLAGISSAKSIVAINKDPSANIFKIADLGIVGDLFEIVPKLLQEIRKAKGRKR